MKYEVWGLKSEVWSLMDWSLSSYDNLKIKISTENAQQYVALQEEFLGDRILDARNLEKNLQPESLNYNLNANR